MARSIIILRTKDLTGPQLHRLMYDPNVQTLCARGPYLVCMTVDGHKHNLPVVDEPAVYAELVDGRMVLDLPHSEDQLHRFDKTVSQGSR